MNRHERRAAAAIQRRLSEGDVISTESFRYRGQHYWFVSPEGWTQEDGLPDDVEIHGPFKTKAEAYKNQEQVIGGPDCEITKGGAWDPAWDRMQ